MVFASNVYTDVFKVLGTMKNSLKILSILQVFSTGQMVSAQQTLQLTETELNAALEKSK